VPAELRRAALAASLFLGAALLLAACGGRDEITRGEASRVVLQPADLGAAYQRFDEGRQLRADAAPPRDDPNRFGRTAGWKARYRARAVEVREGTAVVESLVDVFGDEDGARRDLDAYREAVSAPTSREVRVSGLGEEGIGRALDQGEAQYFTLAWRSANATASVTVSGFGITLEDALALARKQQARLDRAGG
jgi:hypothetical protein